MYFFANLDRCELTRLSRDAMVQSPAVPPLQSSVCILLLWKPMSAEPAKFTMLRLSNPGRDAHCPDVMWPTRVFSPLARVVKDDADLAPNKTRLSSRTSIAPHVHRQWGWSRITDPINEVLHSLNLSHWAACFEPKSSQWAQYLSPSLRRSPCANGECRHCSDCLVDKQLSSDSQSQKKCSQQEHRIRSQSIVSIWKKFLWCASCWNTNKLLESDTLETLTREQEWQQTLWSDPWVD